MRPEDLTPREGKTLRYVKGHGDTTKCAVTSAQCVVLIVWSDLPRTVLQARATLERLRSYGLVIKVGKNGYEATPAGRKLLAVADKARMWYDAPPPAVTNAITRR